MFVIPVEIQVAPPFVVLKTPPPHIAAYTVEGVKGSTAKHVIFPPYGPPVVHVFRPAQSEPAERTKEQHKITDDFMNIRIANIFRPFLGVKVLLRS